MFATVKSLLTLKKCEARNSVRFPSICYPEFLFYAAEKLQIIPGKSAKEALQKVEGEALANETKSNRVKAVAKALSTESVFHLWLRAILFRFATANVRMFSQKFIIANQLQPHLI